MSELYGKTYSRAELLQRVGDISQIARATPYRLAEGPGEGVLAVDVVTGGGLEFTVLPGRGMDIAAARYNGRPLAWRSAVMDRHAAFFEPENTQWLRSFGGGLVATCGLTWSGAACVDEGVALGLHGRVGNTPASQVVWNGRWEGDNYILSVTGKVREAIVFGANVELTRTIEARMGESRFVIHDHVENLGFERTPHMMLYHINLGYPVVDSGSRLIARSKKVTPRDADAEKGVGSYDRFEGPTPGYAEQCFFHELEPGEDGLVTTAVVNPELDGGLGVYARFDKAQLPCFSEWKMVSQGTYVVGMEPGNSLVLGRAEERKAGRLQFLAPGESRDYRLELGVLTGGERIMALERQTVL